MPLVSAAVLMAGKGPAAILNILGRQRGSPLHVVMRGRLLLECCRNGFHVIRHPLKVVLAVRKCFGEVHNRHPGIFSDALDGLGLWPLRLLVVGEETHRFGADEVCGFLQDGGRDICFLFDRGAVSFRRLIFQAGRLQEVQGNGFGNSNGCVLVAGLDLTELAGQFGEFCFEGVRVRSESGGRFGDPGCPTYSATASASLPMASRLYQTCSLNSP